MNFEQVIKTLNNLLEKKQPHTFNSSWILRYSPRCYRFIHKNIRTEIGNIDWDKVTCALNRKYQRHWVPRKLRKDIKFYRDHKEVKLALKKYRDKLYVFIAPVDLEDRHIRDIISITLVRLAQRGNLSAQKKLKKLLTYTINDWLERYYFLSRWQGYEDKVQQQLDGCIRRYRYSGSFINYVFRTLEYSGRGIPAFYVYSLDEPVAYDAKKCKIDNVICDPETGEARIYDRNKYTDLGE